MSFLGHAVDGDISHYGRKKVEQAQASEFIAAFDQLFQFPEVVAVRWEQYTPYFNDGDACEFTAHDARVKLVGAADDAGDYEDGFVDVAGDFPADYFQTHSRGEWVRNPHTGRNTRVLPPGMLPVKYEDMEFFVNSEPRRDIQQAFRAVNSVVAGGEHEVVLHEKFGDPAEVTAVRDPDGAGYRFEVEYYEHD